MKRLAKFAIEQRRIGRTKGATLPRRCCAVVHLCRPRLNHLNRPHRPRELVPRQLPRGLLRGEAVGQVVGVGQPDGADEDVAIGVAERHAEDGLHPRRAVALSAADKIAREVLQRGGDLR